MSINMEINEKQTENTPSNVNNNETSLDGSNNATSLNKTETSPNSENIVLTKKDTSPNSENIVLTKKETSPNSKTPDSKTPINEVINKKRKINKKNKIYNQEYIYIKKLNKHIPKSRMYNSRKYHKCRVNVFDRYDKLINRKCCRYDSECEYGCECKRKIYQRKYSKYNSSSNKPHYYDVNEKICGPQHKLDYFDTCQQCREFVVDINGEARPLNPCIHCSIKHITSRLKNLSNGRKQQIIKYIIKTFLDQM